MRLPTIFQNRFAADEACEICGEICEKKYERTYNCPCKIQVCNDCIFYWAKQQIQNQL